MNENKTNINWYPGHMKKTRELIQDNLKDARLWNISTVRNQPAQTRTASVDLLIGQGKRY